eukprot:6249757-Prymnesium_polylepis.1
MARQRAAMQAQQQQAAWAAHLQQRQAVVAARDGAQQPAWRSFYDELARARATAHAALEQDLIRAWTTHLATGGRG